MSDLFSAPGTNDEPLGQFSESTVTSKKRRGRKPKAKGDKKVTKSSVKTAGRIALFMAIVAFVAIVLLLKSPPKTYVAEASVQIPPLSSVTSQDITAVALPKSAIISGAFTSTTKAGAISKAQKAIASSPASYPIPKGGQLLLSDFQAITPNTSNIKLAPNQRLISVSVPTARAIGGTIRPGFRVDVVTVDSNGSPAARVVAQNVYVVAASISSNQVATTTNKSTAPPAGAIVKGVYVLRVHNHQVLPIELSDYSGHIYLVYTPPGATPLSTSSLSLNTLVCGTQTSC